MDLASTLFEAGHSSKAMVRHSKLSRKNNIFEIWNVLDGLFTTLVYSRRRSRFVNSAFPNKKIWPKNRRLLWQTNLKANVCKNSTFQVNRKKNGTGRRRLTSSNRAAIFVSTFMRRTTQQTLLTINLASQQKTTKRYFSSQVRK